MKAQSVTLNVSYDAPPVTWQKLSLVYSRLEGWLEGYESPSWFGVDENEKHVWASVEPGGLLFCGLMADEEWEQWVRQLTEMATHALGYKVFNIEDMPDGRD
ncbi:hypothetical protein [Taibaiella koreensis]|uniref:hypothetical protein n=1 Tax=Taibaiella koreensis TaxID=1268548 RepID=UPI000E59DC4B|nr:hypothetical protein [Taibaiella koreensis]